MDLDRPVQLRVGVVLVHFQHHRESGDMNRLIAQAGYDVGGTISGEGPLGNLGRIGNITGAVSSFDRLISLTVGIMTVIAGIWFIFILFSGALGIMSSGGEKQSLEKARSQITTGLVGLVVVIAGIFLVSLIGEIMGLSILTPASFILNAWNP